MTRREAAEKVFISIRENGFKPTEIQYGDCYFIFDKGEDGVVHFKIKGLHGWKFAMWIETDVEALKNDNGEDYPAVQFFCQHTINIDKFKPSRSFFLVNFSLNAIQSDDPWKFYVVRDMLQMIKRHPFIAFTMDLCEDTYYHGSYILCYLQQRLYKTKKSIKEWWRDVWVRIWHGPKVWLIKHHKVVSSAELVDHNHDGWVSHPRYDMNIHFAKVFDDEEKQCEAEFKVVKRFFHKNYYKNMHLFLTREGIEQPYCYDRK